MSCHVTDGSQVKAEAEGRVLITFLGAGSADKRRRYREATYDFGNGDVRTTQFFGLSLFEHLQADELVILGTSGSMWDVLLIEQELAGADSEAVDRLSDAADTGTVGRDLLQELEPMLTRNIGAPVKLDIIPYGTDAEQQQAIVSLMAAHAERAATVHLDVTHGLRHLPIVSLAAAQVIEATLGRPIEGIHYGALELTREGTTPVVSLSGLLEIQHWLSAFQVFERNRDYSVFVPLLRGRIDQDALDHLSMASFYERLNDSGKSKEQLKKFRQSLGEHEHQTPLERLFFPQLNERIAWSLEGSLATRQLSLARTHLAHSDYLRATIIAFEAWISARVKHQGGRETHREDRNFAKDSLKRRPHFKILRQIRNAVTHGDRPDTKEAQQAISSPTKMAEVLEECLEAIQAYIDRTR